MVSEKRLLTELLSLYKDSPCLWDPREFVYSNKELKDKAYEVLLEKYKEIHEEATMVDLKRKIEHMRASYRREHKKVLLSRLKGDVNEYTPQLWYYDLMTFLNDVSDFIKLDTTHKENEEDSKNNSDERLPRKRAKKIKTTDLSHSSTIYLPEHNSRSSDNQINSVDEFQIPLKQENDSYPDPNIFTTEESSSETTAVALPSNESNLPEYESFGTTIGLQLKDLDPVQRVIAEKLISDVIFDARLNRLTFNSTITHNSVV